MFTIIAQTASEQALRFLLHWTDVWQIDEELDLFRIGHEIGCGFTFPDGDPRPRKVLSYLREQSSEWTILKEGRVERPQSHVDHLILPKLHLPERAQSPFDAQLAGHRG